MVSGQEHSKADTMKIPLSMIVALVITYFALFVLSMYGGYSDKAKVFCTLPCPYKTSGVGVTGKVVVWLRVFSMFLLFSLGLFTALAVLANRSFCQDKYEEHKRSESKQQNYEDSSSGFEAIDAFKWYETHPMNAFSWCNAIVHAFWGAWIVWGLVILRFHIPWQCTESRLGDNTSLIMMYVVIFLSVVPICSATYVSIHNH